MIPPTEQTQMINFQTDPSLMTNTEPNNMFTADMQHAVSILSGLDLPTRDANRFQLWGDFGMWDVEFWNPYITNQTPM